MVRPRNQRTLTAHDRTCQMPTVCRKSSQVAVHPHGVLSLGHYLVISVISACFTKSQMQGMWVWHDAAWFRDGFLLGLPFFPVVSPTIFLTTAQGFHPDLEKALPARRRCALSAVDPAILKGRILIINSGTDINLYFWADDASSWRSTRPCHHVMPHLRLECCSNCRWWEKSPLGWAVVTLAILTSIVDRDGFLGLFESSAKSGCKKACWSSCGDWCASFDWLSQLNSLPVPHWCAQKHHIAKHWWFPKTVRSSRSRIFCMKFHEIPHRWPTESGFLQSRCGCTQRCCQTMSFEGLGT